MRYLVLFIMSLLLCGCQAQTSTSKQPLKQRLAMAALTPQMQHDGLHSATILRNRQLLVAYRCPTKKIVTDAPTNAKVYQLQISQNGRYHIVYLHGEQMLLGTLNKPVTLAQFKTQGTQTTATELKHQLLTTKVNQMTALIKLDQQTAMYRQPPATHDVAADFDGPANMANMTRTKAVQWAWNHYHHDVLADNQTAVLTDYRVDCTKAPDGTWTIGFRKPVSGSDMTRLMAEYQLTINGHLLQLIANDQ